MKERRNTKQFLISDLLSSGKSRREAYAILRPMVEMQQAPMVFKGNNPVKGLPRIPKTIGEQLTDLGYAINRIANALHRYEDSEDFEYGEMEDKEIPEIEDDSEDEIEETEEKKPVKSITSKIEDAKRWYLGEVRRIRAFCESREMSGESVDEISVRPLDAGDALIPAGIPPKALLHAMSLHWSPESRRDAGIEDFDFISLSRKIMEDRGIGKITRSNGAIETPHAMFGYALALLEARQPVLAIGPSGTGKSHLAAQIADYLETPYGEAAMSPGASRGDLLGRHTIAGFIPAEFVEKYSGGGIFNFEEIDAADPGMILVLNNAIESNRLYNSVSGEMHEKSENLMLWATANTMMLGANRSFTGREKQDASVIDRWRMGRMILKVDPKVEESILGL